MKFHLQSTDANFHRFATVRGNVQCFHGKMIISNSKIPSFHEGFDMGSEPYPFITKYCCNVSLVGEIMLLLAIAYLSLKIRKNVLLKQEFESTGRIKNLKELRKAGVWVYFSAQTHIHSSQFLGFAVPCRHNSKVPDKTSWKDEYTPLQ